MKGPYQRLKYDLRRLWECPVCTHRAHAPGDVTALLCRCQQQADPAARRFMRLIDDTPRRIQINAVSPSVPAEPVSAPTPPVSVTTDSLPSPD